MFADEVRVEESDLRLGPKTSVRVAGVTTMRKVVGSSPNSLSFKYHCQEKQRPLQHTTPI